MSYWDSGPQQFWEGVHEHPREFFNPTNESRSQAKYLSQHPEIQALATLFVAHMCQNPKRDSEVLKAAGLFFTRPAEVLQAEVDDLMKKTNKDGPREELQKKYPRYSTPNDANKPVPDCLCSSSMTLRSVYSSFISRSTSATTLPSVSEGVPPTPTIDEVIIQMITRALDKGLKNMYATRNHDILYDEAYIFLMKSVQDAVEIVWVPIIDVIKSFINRIVDDAVKIAAENLKMTLLTTDKLPIKVNRLKNNFNGFTENKDYPVLKEKEIKDTLHSRRGTYNRYPKDMFGVYLPTFDDSLGESVTYPPVIISPNDSPVDEETNHWSDDDYNDLDEDVE